MGSATALFLARRGISVTLVDRRQVGAGATVASFGNIRRSGRYLPQMPLAHRSLALWGELDALLGQDVEFRATGHLRLIFDAEGLTLMLQYQTEARNWGLDLQELTPAEIRRRFPGLGPSAIAASFSPQDGSANPRLIAPAFAAAAARLGAQMLPQTEARAIEQSDGGFVLDSSAGPLRGDVLVNCAGGWGPEIAARFEEPVPCSFAGPQMGVTEPLPHRILPVVGQWSKEHGAYLRQVERGNVIFGGAVPRTKPARDGYAKIDPTALPEQMRAVLRMVPALRDVAILRQWSGLEGYVEDMLPVMGPSATTPGLYHAFGFCGHGFQLGPGVGDTIAELIATGHTETPLDPFSISRFAPCV